MTAVEDLKRLLKERNPRFWDELATASRDARTFDELFYLSRLRARWQKDVGVCPPRVTSVLRIAILSGATTYPLRDLLEHLLAVDGIGCTLFVGEFDNYAAEILEPDGALYGFRPDVVILFPSERRCRYEGRLDDPLSQQRASALDTVQRLHELCDRIHDGTGAEVILGNFIPPAYHDPGPFRSRTLAFEWNYRRLVNLELGLGASAHVHICDLEYLASRRGLLAARDDRGWFESKQPCAPDTLVDVARELAYIVKSLRQGAKKVLVLDLDNTLWGGVIGDDGLQGIELGDTSPRGEAFKAFQRFVRSLSDRGVLLAVCSKNDEAVAREAFERHPEMVLRLEDFASFKANWQPKSENIRAMADELSLGLESFVFVDDNPAEIEIVRQFCPGVTTLLAAPDPASFVAIVQEARLFEPLRLTAEDLVRASQYRVEGERRALMANATDMDAYLRSLDMVARVRALDDADLPRATQLINKSNQFNLTTRRRTEAEVRAFVGATSRRGFTVRLADRFGDHGLVSVVLVEAVDRDLHVDTWVMSCRVLKRQVEDVVINEIVRLAEESGCHRIIGVYLPTPKNGMVRDLYPRMGFLTIEDTPDRSSFRLDVGRETRPRDHHIQIERARP